MKWKKILIRQWYLQKFNKAEKKVAYYRKIAKYGEQVGVETLSGRRKGKVMQAQSLLPY